MYPETQPSTRRLPLDGTVPGRRDFLQRYATVATVATFAVVGVTGVLIFFHVGERSFMTLHEWAGIAFVAAAALHVIRHARAFSTLLAKPRARWAMATAGLTAIAFVGAAEVAPGGGNPMKLYVEASAGAPISVLAQVVGETPADMTSRFAQAGISGITDGQTLRDIEASTGVDMPRLFAIVLGGETAD